METTTKEKPEVSCSLAMFSLLFAALVCGGVLQNVLEFLFAKDFSLMECIGASFLLLCSLMAVVDSYGR